MIEEPNVNVIKVLEANGVKSDAVDVQRKSAREYLQGSFGFRGYEESTVWIESIWLRRYSLHKVQIRHALCSSSILAPQASPRFFDGINEM